MLNIVKIEYDALIDKTPPERNPAYQDIIKFLQEERSRLIKKVAIKIGLGLAIAVTCAGAVFGAAFVFPVIPTYLSLWGTTTIALGTGAVTSIVVTPKADDIIQGKWTNQIIQGHNQDKSLDIN